MKLPQILCLLWATASTSLPALAQESRSPQISKGLPTAPAARTDSNSSLTIPFQVRDNLIVLTITVNGRPQTAVLDSGSGALVIDDKVATQLGLGAKKSVGEVAGAGAEAQQLRPVEVASVVVGPVQLQRHIAYAVNLTQLSTSAGFPIDVIVGAPAFKDRVVTIDYRRKLATFAPSGSAHSCTAPIPMTIVHDVPVIEAALQPTEGAEPIRLKLVVDLGTRHNSLMLGGTFVRSAAGKAMLERGVPKQVGHGTGGPVQGTVTRAASIGIGPIRVAQQDVALTAGVGAFNAAGFDGSLGVPFWNQGSITFDYGSNVICIER